MDNFILQEYLEDVSICDQLVDIHKLSDNKRDGLHGVGEEKNVNSQVKLSTDVTFYPKEIASNNVLKKYFDQLQNIVHIYIKKYPLCNSYAAWGINEGFNIQHYKHNEGYFVWHTERGNAMLPNSSRHLVFMTYLNDVNDEGETEFYHQELKVKPRKGLTLIWPADWTHTHRGITSKTEEKYILTGWFNFLETSI
jgi:prolyl 4-hydroxylase